MAQFEKLDRRRELVEVVSLTLRVADIFPAERAADARRRFEARGTRARIVLFGPSFALGLGYLLNREHDDEVRSGGG